MSSFFETSPTASPRRRLSSNSSSPRDIYMNIENHISSPPKIFSSPTSSKASSESSCTYSDRYIPSRLSSNLEDAFEIMGSNEISNQLPIRNDVAHENQGMMNNLLRAELLKQPIVVSSKLELELNNNNGASSSSSSPNDRNGNNSINKKMPNMFRYKSSSLINDSGNAIDLSIQPFGSKSPTDHGISSPHKIIRKIPKTPYKILDAPLLQDDYYLNLIDWSSTNVLSVALGPSVYLWSAYTSKVTKLCELPTAEESITSLSWSLTGNHIAVGTNSGQVQIWDAAKGIKIKELAPHTSRVGSLAWNSNVIASGSRDRNIFIQDIRIRNTTRADDNNQTEPSVVQHLSAHKQEVCGLKWSFDERMLASGGNDNKLYVWSPSQTESTPICKFDDHTAAVKAVAWSPHQHGVLASGGGTADRHIRFWNALTSSTLHRIDTGSQVCNLMWSKNVNEIVSTHGYSLNQIIVWKYPTMQKLTTLTGHSLRVLYLAMSPDGQCVVTGAGDETLRFWNIFPGPRSTGGTRIGQSTLLPNGADIR